MVFSFQMPFYFFDPELAAPIKKFFDIKKKIKFFSERGISN